MMYQGSVLDGKRTLNGRRRRGSIRYVAPGRLQERKLRTWRAGEALGVLGALFLFWLFVCFVFGVAVYFMR